MASRDEVLTAIGDAIQTYAMLEFKLFQLLRRLMNAEPDTAAAVFYSMRNSRDRNSAVRALVKVEFGDEFQDFWNSMNGLISGLDGRRNQIVHGLVVCDDAADPPNHFIVRPESYWVEEWPVGEALAQADLTEFVNKTRVVGELVQHFVYYISGAVKNPDFAKKWHDVLMGPVVYPLPPDHPLNG